MAFLGRRFLSSSTRLYTAISTPAPVHRIPALSNQELQSLSQKSQGSWKELTKEEKITLYRASFPETFREANNPPKQGMKILFGISVSLVIAYLVAEFMRRTVGPTLPSTYQNKEWEADTRAKLLRQKANPIEGISSRS